MSVISGLIFTKTYSHKCAFISNITYSKNFKEMNKG